MSTACSQDFGPGYRFDLFKNTPNWELAKAVEKENKTEIKKLITQGKLNINLQESKFGETLLLLAVGNDKLISTKALLEEGANVNIKDFVHGSPIDEATFLINQKKNTVDILKLLIKHGANVNDTFVKKKNNDTVSTYTPLVGGCSNLECAKLLLSNGANPYVQTNNTYLVWFTMLTNYFDESIYVLKHIIVDKKMAIPNLITINFPNKRPLDIFYLLNKENFRTDTNKQKVKQEILDYLHKINFPKNQVYRSSRD